VTWTEAGILLGASFVTFFFGYALGRRVGRREGVLEGIACAPLELRRRSWEKGACLVCGTVAGMQEERAAVDGPLSGNADV